jgi:hypothetical protein
VRLNVSAIVDYLVSAMNVEYRLTKHDQTTDLLNAIVRASWTQFEKMEISDKMDGFRP